MFQSDSLNQTLLQLPTCPNRRPCPINPHKISHRLCIVPYRSKRPSRHSLNPLHTRATPQSLDHTYKSIASRPFRRSVRIWGITQHPPLTSRCTAGLLDRLRPPSLWFALMMNCSVMHHCRSLGASPSPWRSLKLRPRRIKTSRTILGQEGRTRP